jgi:glutaredoxin 3
MAKVKVYTTPTCVYCVTVKNFLKEKNIDFQEVDVSQDKEAADQMIEKTGQMGVPVIEIDQEVVVGFDRDKIIKLLNL